MNNTKIAAISVGILGGLSFLMWHFNKNKQGVSVEDRISLEEVRQISQQIKYQMILQCSKLDQFKFSQFLQVLKGDQKKKYKQNIQKNVNQIYQSREKIILQKFDKNKDDYAQALQQYNDDEVLSKNIQEILDIIQKSKNGEILNYQVCEQSRKVKSKEQLKEIYYNLNLNIIKLVWQKTKQFCQKDQNFNPSDDSSFKNVIRVLQIYKYKVDALQKQGFLKTWGCPNEIFLKIIEKLKSQDRQFKTIIAAIQKAYNEMIDLVSNTPFKIQQFQIPIKMKQLTQKQKTKGFEILQKQLNTTGQKNQLQMIMKQSKIYEKKIEQRKNQSNQHRLKNIISQQLLL